MSSSRVTVYDRSGQALSTLKCSTERSWVLNGEGMCTITLAVNDAKARQSILQYGNLMTIEHAELPLWAGVIDTDRAWGNAKLTLTAWSAERLFKFRRGPLNLPLRESSAGALFQKLIAIANADEDLRVRDGDIWYGGTPRDETMDGRNIYDHVQEIAARTGHDWSIEGALDENGRLYFQADWYETKGSMSGLQLREGTNIVAAEYIMTEQGIIVNDLMGIGDGSTPESRISYVEIDKTSRGLYGLRQAAQDYSGNKEIGTLIANVRGTLAQSKHPIRTVIVTALDKGDTFKALRLGNILPLYMTTAGFLDDGNVGMNTNARILGMQYNDDFNQVGLVLQEEVLDAD